MTIEISNIVQNDRKMSLVCVQKWKKSGSLQQLALKDAVDIRQTFLYKLASRSNLQHFKNVLLAGKIFTQDCVSASH
jgi:hypothetical protein